MISSSGGPILPKGNLACVQWIAVLTLNACCRFTIAQCIGIRGLYTVISRTCMFLH